MRDLRRLCPAAETEIAAVPTESRGRPIKERANCRFAKPTGLQLRKRGALACFHRWCAVIVATTSDIEQRRKAFAENGGSGTSSCARGRKIRWNPLRLRGTSGVCSSFAAL